ncbi:MAG: hypothetical protein P4L34_06450 [Paludibacter sp.]|nr:hypothetical protein [Paludibacter sp.]
MRKVISTSIFILIFVGKLFSAEPNKVTFFGSYNIGISYLPFKATIFTDNMDRYLINQLKAGVVNEFEAGVFFNSFGLGIISNLYSNNASTMVNKEDVYASGILVSGTLTDKSRFDFVGLELIHKKQLSNSKLDINWKIAPGVQWYYVSKNSPMENFYLKDIYTKCIFDVLLGTEINYHISKIIDVGAGISILPGYYDKLTLNNHSSTKSDNVSRINTVLKLTVNL